MDNAVSQEGFASVDDNNGAQQNQQLTLVDLQQYTISSVRSINSLQKDLKNARQMLKDAIEGNSTYHENKERVNEVTSVLKQTKEGILSQPSVAAIKQKIKDLTLELKDKNAEVSEAAMQIFRETGAQEFEKDGETYDIVAVARVVKRHQ